MFPTQLLHILAQIGRLLTLEARVRSQVILWRARNNRKGVAKSVFYVVRAMPIAMQRVAKHILAETNARDNMTSIARQRSSKHGVFRGVHAEEL
jgi:hypothetical protein